MTSFNCVCLFVFVCSCSIEMVSKKLLKDYFKKKFYNERTSVNFLDLVRGLKPPTQTFSVIKVVPSTTTTTTTNKNNKKLHLHKIYMKLCILHVFSQIYIFHTQVSCVVQTNSKWEESILFFSLPSRSVYQHSF
jgi:hypothetical protein